jgi:outer membrane protein assembly factor BamB
MPHSLRSLSLLRAATLLLLLAGQSWWARAEDWPEWRGKGRRGVWNETGIVDTFPAEGLRATWKHPVKAGYAGPAVAAGRVFVTDFARGQGNRGVERALCLQEDSGKLLWSREWDADYAGLQYELGPRATPTVDGDRVYTLGATGVLHCLNSQTGEVIWRKDYRQDYAADLPAWGMVGAPLVEGEQLICLVGGKPGAKVVSLDKRTGKEIWRALDSGSEPGYSPPIVMEVGGRRQLIIWHPGAVVSLEPMTGKPLWEQPFTVNAGLTVATPVIDGARLLVSSFYNGSRLFKVPGAAASAELIWKGNSDSEIETDGLHSLIATPVMDGDYIYGICSYGQFRCLDARTGRRVWETMEVTRENERWATGLIVRHQDRYFINNDRGELILAKLSPEGYHEISRTQLIRPTNPVQRRREMGGVHWSHPAYANRHIVVRNDEEIIRFSLAK